MGKKLFTPEKFEEIFSQVPRLCVDLIVRKDNGVALSLRGLGSWNNSWHFSGGTVYYRESIEDAVRRIAEEEMGIQVEIVKLLGYMEFFSEEKERGFGYSVSLAFLCDYKSGELRPDEDALEIKVFSAIPGDEVRMIEEHRDFLKEHWAEISG